MFINTYIYKIIYFEFKFEYYCHVCLRKKIKKIKLTKKSKYVKYIKYVNNIYVN